MGFREKSLTALQFSFLVTELFFSQPAFDNFLSELFIGFCKFCGSLRHTLVELSGDSLLLAEETCLLQSHGGLVCSYLEEESLRLFRETEPLSTPRQQCQTHRGHPVARTPRKNRRFQSILARWGAISAGHSQATHSSAMPNSRTESVDSSSSAPRIISIEGPPSGSFKRTNTNASWQHPEQRVQQSADNLLRLPARPQGRKCHDADQVAQAAAQSRHFLGWGFERRLHVRPPCDARPASLSTRSKFGQKLLRRTKNGFC